MSDKNRVITNGLFRKKMAELLGEDIINTPQFNDFQALDVSTFTREMDKLIDNPPWSGGGSGGESELFIVKFTIDEHDVITCDKTIEQIMAATKPVVAFATIPEIGTVALSSVPSDPSSPMFAWEVLTDEYIQQMVIIGDYAQGLDDTWTAQNGQIKFDQRLIATFTFDEGTSSFTCDKSYSAVSSAFDSNKGVLGIFTAPTTGIVHKMEASIKNASNSIIFTSTNIPESGKIEVITVEYASDGSITPSDVIVNA